MTYPSHLPRGENEMVCTICFIFQLFSLLRISVSRSEYLGGLSTYVRNIQSTCEQADNFRKSTPFNNYFCHSLNVSKFFISIQHLFNN